MDSIFKEYDLDKSGSIDRKEFKKFVKKEFEERGQKFDEKEMKMMFDGFDFDEDGKITKENILSMLKEFAKWEAEDAKKKKSEKKESEKKESAK